MNGMNVRKIQKANLKIEAQESLITFTGAH